MERSRDPVSGGMGNTFQNQRFFFGVDSKIPKDKQVTAAMSIRAQMRRVTDLEEKSVLAFQMSTKNSKNSIKRRDCQKKTDKTSANASDHVGQGAQKKSFLDMATLIRSIQRAEGQTDCFKMGMADCDHMDCKWRAFCL